MTGRLDGVSCLVTGGASGIGRAVATAYLSEGATVTVLDRCGRTSAELDAAVDGRINLVLGDATDPAVVAGAVREATRFGGRLDQLTCCVGIHDQHAALGGIKFDRLPDAFGELFSVNVLSALLAVHAASDQLLLGRGSVTLTLSEAAFHPRGGGVLYGASKWALRGVVDHLARELAPRVRVNAVSPGGTAGTRLAGTTALGQLSRADERPGREERIAAGSLLGVVPLPEDHAEAFVYLAAPQLARVVTGCVICTDGGQG